MKKHLLRAAVAAATAATALAMTALPVGATTSAALPVSPTACPPGYVGVIVGSDATGEVYVCTNAELPTISPCPGGDAGVWVQYDGTGVLVCLGAIVGSFEISSLPSLWPVP